MSESYPRRDQARGIWKINDITKNIKEVGTYPQGSSKALFQGGNTPSYQNTVDFINVNNAGNATDFGDLSVVRNATGGVANTTRAIAAGGYNGSDFLSTIDYAHFATTGNYADFGDLTVATTGMGGTSNGTRGVMSGGQDPSTKTNKIETLQIASLGNATDYGDLTQGRSVPTAAQTPIRSFSARAVEKSKIQKIMKELGLDFEYETQNPRKDNSKALPYAEAFFERRKRKGLTLTDAERLILNRAYYAAQMVALGDADGFVGGVRRNYADVLRPCIEVIGPINPGHHIVGCYMMVINGKLVFLGDATVNVYPDSETLAEIAVEVAKVARRFGISPKVAMLSFSDFGSSRAQRSERIEQSIEIARSIDPSLVIDGPMQGDTALDVNVQKEYPFMTFKGPANVLICPNLASANIAYKLLENLGGAEMTGPILEGFSKPVQLVARSDDVRHIVNMAAICALDAIRQDSYWDKINEN